MKRYCFLLALVIFAVLPTPAQDTYIAPPENLVVDGVPKIPAALADTAGRYPSFRSSSLLDRHPTKPDELIATRVSATAQLHPVARPGGAPHQPTLYPDAVLTARFHPNRGAYIL